MNIDNIISELDGHIESLNKVDIRHMENFKCMKCGKLSVSAVKNYIPVCVECREKFGWNEREWENGIDRK